MILPVVLLKTNNGGAHYLMKLHFNVTKTYSKTSMYQMYMEN
jgi:hypothetical protein